MPTPRPVIALMGLVMCVGLQATAALVVPVAHAVRSDLVGELSPVIERARQRFEARDADGVLAHVSEQYRSGGLTKADLRQQLLAMFELYETLRVRVSINSAQPV